MRSFAHDTDLKEVNNWLLARSVAPFELKDLPKFGMIEEGIACGFLAICEGNTCFLEAFVTNPHASNINRGKAIYRISKWLLGVASAAGMKQCLVLTNDISLMNRAKELGFAIGSVAVGKKLL